MSITQEILKMASVDIFTEAKKGDLFIGRPYYLDYEKAYLLIADAWKQKVGGLPQGVFILAFYENENDEVDECLLLRAICPTKLPTDSDVIASMVEFYKDNLKTSGKHSQLDDYTRYMFSFSGLECRILGTFFKNNSGQIQFGADVENFYSAHHYVAYKPIGEVLEFIVNFRDRNSVVGNSTNIPIGKVRYSSSRRFQEGQEKVSVYVNPQDFLGKRTALFGMTRTGKSNTVKKIIQATTEQRSRSKNVSEVTVSSIEENLKQFDDSGFPKYKVGQIIFDINGEYANANLQDEGTAIFEKYAYITTRYSVLEKANFKVLKVNLYNEIEAGFDLINNFLAGESGDYVKSFLSVDLMEPEERESSDYTRWERKIAAYKCCLYRAGFEPPKNYKIKFQGNKEINSKINDINPANGITFDEAIRWFTWVAENCDNNVFFKEYKNNKGHDWVDEDLRTLLVFLTRKRNLTGSVNISGYKKLNPLKPYHTSLNDTAFEEDIVNKLREGEIIIIDLSQGDPKIQQTFSERICKCIFRDAMDHFIHNRPNNFIQFYFEEAHNLFPKKEDKDLSQIYMRIAKEGAKLNLGMVYATQEVSSISSNILKNTQNWFIAHLNNEDELKEIKKFYDFGDFCEGLIRFSPGTDKGFIRMKTYSNSFVVPVQIDRFLANE